jgi:hypothetical protein
MLCDKRLYLLAQRLALLDVHYAAQGAPKGDDIADDHPSRRVPSLTVDRRPNDRHQGTKHNEQHAGLLQVLVHPRTSGVVPAAFRVSLPTKSLAVQSTKEKHATLGT